VDSLARLGLFAFSACRLLLEVKRTVPDITDPKRTECNSDCAELPPPAAEPVFNLYLNCPPLYHPRQCTSGRRSLPDGFRGTCGRSRSRLHERSNCIEQLREAAATEQDEGRPSMGLAASQTGCRWKGIRAPSFRMTSSMKSGQIFWFETGAWWSSLRVVIVVSSTRQAGASRFRRSKSPHGHRRNAPGPASYGRLHSRGGG
jgi:hypothetical protein